MRLATAADLWAAWLEVNQERRIAETLRDQAYRDFPRRYRPTFTEPSEDEWRPVQIACQNLDAAIRKVRELEAAEALAWNRYQERRRVEARGAPTW